MSHQPAPLARSSGNVRCQLVYIRLFVVDFFLCSLSPSISISFSVCLCVCSSLRFFCLLDGQHVLTEHTISDLLLLPLWVMRLCSRGMHISYGHKPKMLLSLLVCRLRPPLIAIAERGRGRGQERGTSLFLTSAEVAFSFVSLWFSLLPFTLVTYLFINVVPFFSNEATGIIPQLPHVNFNCCCSSP